MRVVEAAEAGFGGETVGQLLYRGASLLIERFLKSAQDGDILGAGHFRKDIVFHPKRGFAEEIVALDDKLALFVQTQRAARGLRLLRFLRETVQRYGRRINHRRRKACLYESGQESLSLS